MGRSPATPSACAIALSRTSIIGSSACSPGGRIQWYPIVPGGRRGGAGQGPPAAGPDTDVKIGGGKGRLLTLKGHGKDPTLKGLERTALRPLLSAGMAALRAATEDCGVMVATPAARYLVPLQHCAGTIPSGRSMLVPEVAGDMLRTLCGVRWQ